MEVTDHDQVGQVGAGQEQRAGVGKEETPVKQRTVSLAPGSISSSPATRTNGVQSWEAAERASDGYSPAATASPTGRDDSQDRADETLTGETCCGQGVI
jgi:hypothetical protein